MPWIDDRSHDFRGGGEGIIANLTQPDEDMNDMSTDEDGGTTTIREAAMAMEVETMAKAACPTKHQVFRCGRRTREV